MICPEFFTDVLADNESVIPLRAEAAIVAVAGGRAVRACHELEIEQFAEAGYCELEPEETPRPSCLRRWGGEDHDRLYDEFQQVVWKVRWNGHGLSVVQLAWSSRCGGEHRDWVLAETAEVADAFILDVERKTHEPGEAILVFSSGYWRRDRNLYRATQSASFDDLVLAEDLKETIRSEFRQFLASEDRYRRLGMAWRRGALLIGPPGNGKTHCVRALVKELNIASLYVQSMRHHHFTASQLWEQVFDRARGLRPCVLVLEDLDSLIRDDDRSFFLNQLDGFERNHGMIVLATTNHPECIDPAILNRPSRFDRKYHFHLPTHRERQAYLTIWQQRLCDETGWSAEALDTFANETSGFSFAYLKELVISSTRHWMHESASDFNAVLANQIALLRRQMTTESEVES